MACAMTCSPRGLCLCLAFIALLNASCAYKSVPLTSTATPQRLPPTPLNQVFAGAGNVHLRGTLYFAEGTFRFADPSRLRVRVTAETTAEYDVDLDMSGSRANAAEVSLKPEVKRFSFRWNRDIEVTNDPRLSDPALEGPRAWLTVRTIQVGDAVAPAAPLQGLDITLGRSLALLVSHVIAEDGGVTLTQAKRIIRSIYLRDSEIGVRDEATPGVEDQSPTAAIGSQGWLHSLSYVPWRPPVIAAPDDAMPAPAEIGAAPTQLETAPASSSGPSPWPPPAGYPPSSGVLPTASAVIEDPRIQLRKDARSSPEYLAGRSTRIAGVVSLSLGGGAVFGGLYALIWGSLRGFGWNTGLGPDRGAQVGGGILMLLGSGAMAAGGAAMVVGKRQMKKVEGPDLSLAMPADLQVHLGAGSLLVSGSF